MGYYGMANFGDDLFCEVLSEAQRRYAPDLRMLVAAPMAGTYVGHSVSLPGWMRSRWSGRGWRSSAARLFGRSRALLAADAVLWAGGSVFSENRGVRRLHDRLALGGDRKQYAIGVSVGPFDSGRHEQEVMHHLNGYDRVMVRDHASLERAGSLHGVSVCGDLGVLLETPAEADVDDRALVGFAPCATATPDFDSLVPLIDSLCASSAGLNIAGIRVLALNGHPTKGDVDLAKRAYERILALGVSAELVIYGADGGVGVHEVARAITSVKALVTHRLHGAIVAYGAGVPFVLQEYHEKCADFLDDIGYPSLCRARHPDDVWPAVRKLLASDRPVPVVPATEYKLRVDESVRAMLTTLSAG